MKIVHYGDVATKRQREYPTVQQQLDVIWKALSELRTKPWSPEVQSMIDQMAVVDAKYPKKPETQ